MRTVSAGLLIVMVVSLLCLATGNLDVYFVDVGHGDAILIDYVECEMLIDGGRGNACVTFLQKGKYIDGSLEVMVATHPHADHIGGLDEVLDAFDVAEVVTNGAVLCTSAYLDFYDSVSDEHCPRTPVSCGGEVELGDLVLTVLHPDERTGDANEDSLVLLLRFKSVSFLFTGDLETVSATTVDSWKGSDFWPSEQDILILKAPHHGLTNSATLALATALHPTLTIISTDDAVPETATDLVGQGLPYLATSTGGTICVSTDGESIRVNTAVSDCNSLVSSGSATEALPSAGERIIITEVEMNPPGSDSGSEWIELYNPTAAPVSLLGWAGSYSGYGGGWDPIPPVTIEPGEYYQFVYPKQHLENTRGESIRLRDSEGIVVDCSPEGLIDDVANGGDDRTWQRLPDGSDQDVLDDWVFRAGTPGEANS